jgi:hypothetical protein
MRETRVISNNLSLPRTSNGNLVENQLCNWSNLLCIRKKLTIDIVFAYRTDDDAVATPASRKGDKRGRV